MKNNRFEIDMTHGSLMPKLISFILPLMLSSFLQLLFNAVDLVIVGHFAKDGSSALAAVGSTSALINLFTTVFIGISMGANVCGAISYARNDTEKMSRVVHTALTTALIVGIAMLLAGRSFAETALKLMDTPDDVIGDAVLYMKIYFLGVPFFMLYNFGAAILRAVGDTKRPMIFLIIAGVINACLNLFLVTVFHLDVEGVAIATVISQAISCILVIIVLLRSPEGYRLHISKLGIDFKILFKILSIGLPAGLQSFVITFSNVLLQSSVNSFGQYAMAGYTAANNVFGFLFVSVNAISQGCMSFTSQNYGARDAGRMRRVLKDCLILETVVGLFLGSIAFFGGRFIIGIYSSDERVIEYGLQVLALTTLTYFICGYMDCIPGSMRGMGYSSVPMILSIIGTVGIRVLWIFGFFPNHRSIKFLFISYPVSWIVTCLMQLICYLIIRKIIEKKLGNNTPQEIQKTESA